MKKIPLTHGLFALVDDADYEWVAKCKWHATEKDPRRAYARRCLNNKGSFMHRELTGARRGLEVDHIDRNRLNNQRANLRVCNRAENARNMVPNSPSSYGFRGIEKHFNRWRATVNCNAVTYKTRQYGSAFEAALAYDALARKLQGEFAVLNYPEFRIECDADFARPAIRAALKEVGK